MAEANEGVIDNQKKSHLKVRVLIIDGLIKIESI
jgi:hypothetical protein